MSLRNKIELLTAALRLGHRFADKRSLLSLFARYGGLSPFRAGDLVIQVNQPPAASLHLRDTVGDAILLVEVLVQEDYDALKQLPIQPATILDIGANIGLGSFYLRHLYPEATLHGLEPAPAESAICERNYQSLGAATLHRVAAGDEDGKTVRFAINADRTGGQHVSRAPAAEAGWQSIAVTLRRIDAMIAEGLLPVPDLVKMDIEGSEVQALKGFGDYLAAPSAYVLETHSAELHAECLTLLGQAGFRVVSDTPRPGTARILCMSRF
jgi:FkbM family methyltransferase